MKVSDVQEPQVSSVSPNISKSQKDTLPEISLKSIPSGFRTYPEGASISYLPYTYGEILKFSQSTMKKAAKIKFVLDGIITSFPKKDLTFFDFLYIAMMRKLSTFNCPEFTIKYNCSACGAENASNFKLVDIDFEDMEVEDLPVAFDLVCGETVEIMPLTVGAYLDLCDKGKQDDQLAVYAATITNHPFVKAERLLSKASGDDISVMREVDEILYFGVRNQKCSCRSCGEETDINITNDGIFIEPFREDEGSVRSKIRFGVHRNS